MIKAMSMKELVAKTLSIVREILADRRKKTIAIAALILLLAMAAALPGYMKKTSTTEYCASCHVMEPQYDDWLYGGRHTQIRCIECHLPNDDFVRHYVWKGLDGVKDLVFFYTGLVPEPIHSSRHARKTIQRNCVRCHDGMLSMVSVDDRNCWECHRSLFHNRINEF